MQSKHSSQTLRLLLCVALASLAGDFKLNAILLSDRRYGIPRWPRREMLRTAAQQQANQMAVDPNLKVQPANNGRTFQLAALPARTAMPQAAPAKVRNPKLCECIRHHSASLLAMQNCWISQRNVKHREGTQGHPW